MLWAERNKYPWGRLDTDKPKCDTLDGNWHCPSAFWGKENGKEYFCVVRNPVDRMVSEANYENIVRKNKSDRITPSNVNAFLQEQILAHHNNHKIKAHYIPQVNYVYVDGKAFCTYILKYENLQKDFALLLRKKGIPDDPQLDRAMVSNHVIQRKHLNKKTLELIQRIYKEDFDTFGYVI